MCKNFKKGISLILLVITIIVLAILAGVVITTLSDTNIIEKANSAKTAQNASEALQEIKFVMSAIQADNTKQITLEDIEYALENNYKDKYDVTAISTGEVLDLNGKVIIPKTIDALYVTNKQHNIPVKIDKNFVVQISYDAINDNTDATYTLGVSIEPYTEQNVVMGVTVLINNLPSSEYIDYTKSRYILTTEDEALGIEDSSYTGGTLQSLITKNNKIEYSKMLPVGKYYLHILFYTTNNEKSEQIYDSGFDVAGIKNFEYTGSMENITLLPGKYKFECWGAQGGNYTAQVCGGKGAYTSGIITITESISFYINVGSTTENYIGGYNGGGNGAYDNSSTYARGGGGATDIRISSDSVLSRIMVAAGGGGASYSSDNDPHEGSAAGILTGYGNYYGNSSFPGGSGGSQTSGGYAAGYILQTSGSFGKGGNGYVNFADTVKHTSGGGGGGYYGGGRR